MKLLFKQRIFSWFDSYDIYFEDGSVAFRVEGQLSWGHKLQIYDAFGQPIGTVKQEIFNLLPCFSLYRNDILLGQIHQKFTLFHQEYSLDCNGWEVIGDFLSWEYQILDENNNLAATASKQIFNWTDTYVISIADGIDPVTPLMVVLAIDAANCSRNG